MARRGLPALILSDNAKTFKSQKLKQSNAEKCVKWKFNLPRAPWWGGIFERQIRMLKRCLLKAVKSARLKYEELETVILEIEAVLNSRPITYVYEDSAVEILTPSHLSYGRRILDNRDYEEIELNDDSVDERLDKVYKVNKIILNHFWDRWSKEYLTSLREVHKNNRSKESLIQKDDLVCVQEEGVKRGKWKLGKVNEVIKGKDGVIRGANIEVITKGGNKGLVTRPIQKLSPLEFSNYKAHYPSQKKEQIEQSIDTDGQLNESKSDEPDEVKKNAEEEVNELLPGTSVPNDSLGGLGDNLKDGIMVSRPKRATAIEGQTRRQILELVGDMEDDEVERRDRRPTGGECYKSRLS